MRFHVCVISLASATCLLAGCSDSKTKTGKAGSALLFAGRSVAFSVPAGEGFSALWEGPLVEWEAQTGGKAQLLERPADDDLPAQLKSGTATLAAFRVEALGELLAEKALAEVPGEVARDPNGLSWADILPGLREALPAKSRQPLVVPVACPVLLCGYREDLLTAAGLAPPRTWDDYQKLVETIETWAPGLSAVEPCDDAFRSTLFLARAVSFAKHPAHYSLFFDIDSSAPLIAGPAFVRALETAAQAWRRMPAEIRGFSPADCRRKLIEGSAALALVVEPAPRSAKMPRDTSASSETRPDAARIGFCRLPGVREMYNATRKTWERPEDKGVYCVTLCGFAGWLAGASSAAPAGSVDAAWNAVVQIGGGSFADSFPRDLVGLCRDSQSRDSALLTGPWRADEASAARDAVLASLRDRAVVLELPVPGRAEFLAALSRGLGRVLDAQASPPEVLQQVEHDWQAVVKKVGGERLRDAYRLALGLPPVSSP